MQSEGLFLFHFETTLVEEIQENEESVQDVE